MTEQQEASREAVMTRIGQAVILLHGGDREEARNRFGMLWSEIGEHGDALHRCTLAHYMADAQDDPDDELAWDLRALTAAGALADGRDGEHRDFSAVRSLYPSLHLNLAADYLRLHRPDAARDHLDRARAAARGLDHAGHDGGVRDAIDRLERTMRHEH
ncbi:hypothetical protein [uncultured Streptomyces sp.]|uniref:hypothetical protein n=1 Tax=uncultured Streptomyces sp. TaxID=174707 RepID=UPI00260F625F|nr:hypothetical protein [uncultured Streptomyces sp.]